jgi:hypothetical protein
LMICDALLKRFLVPCLNRIGGSVAHLPAGYKQAATALVTVSGNQAGL